MLIEINSRVLELLRGDIAQQAVDAIVNAANAALAGGGGVDGAIHSAGGPEIMQETNLRYPQGCPTGSAVISGAGKLSARYVIHAVGPVWRGGMHGEPELLTSAFRTSLELARDHDCQSIALPAISTGAYGYPVKRAARVAISTAIAFLQQGELPRHVRFVLFEADALDCFAAVLEELAAEL